MACEHGIVGPCAACHVIRLTAERDALRAEVDRLKGEHADGSDTCGCWKCVAYRLQAEVERLKAEAVKEESATSEMQREYEAALAWRCGQIDSLRALVRELLQVVEDEGTCFELQDRARAALGEP